MNDLKTQLAMRVAALKRLETGFRLDDFCFPEQLAFITDPASFKTAVCSRRSGKTIACAADLIDTAIRHKDVVCLYVTLSRKNAKRIIWPELTRINREYDLGGEPNESDLSLKFKNGSIIYVSGAKDKSEIENYRGLPIKKAYVDESQSFRDYIRDLIDDVISKALFDHNGTLCLIGTPGLVPAGYFYECATSAEWSHHEWTMFQNPHLEKKSGMPVMELVRRDMDRMGVKLDHPKIQRECFGKWVVDGDSLIFKYNESINSYDDIPALASKWEYVIGVDVGHDDADAISVLGWTATLPSVYLVEERITTKQGITELADQIEALMVTYDPLRIVMDTGGLGKKIAEEIKRRRSIPIMPAEKARKMEFIELLNDAMRTRRFFAKKGSAFAQDCFLVERDKDKTTSDKIVISDRYHSDICDAVLYAYRESLHWLHVPAVQKVTIGTEEFYQREAAAMEQAAVDRYEQSRQESLEALESYV